MAGMTSNVAAVLIALIGCLAGVGFALVTEGTPLATGGLFGGLFVAGLSLGIAAGVARYSDE